MPAGKKGLGAGLSNLFGEDLADISAAGATEVTAILPLAKIESNPNQPRKQFDQNALEELAESIKQHGVVTPITVREGEKKGFYQIIAGERRWRAARMAGLEKIPAMILNVSENEVMELALIENLQRQDLNPIEEAEGYDLLMREFGLTQEEVSHRVVKSRSSVANSLRLLALPEEVRVMLIEGKISGGHARAVLAVEDESARIDVAKEMSKLTVRQAEVLAKKINKAGRQKMTLSEESGATVDYVQEAAKELETILGRKVTITQGKKMGSLTMEYYGNEDLERLLEALHELRV